MKITINDIIENNQNKAECLIKTGFLKYSCLGLGENYTCEYKSKCYHKSKYENIHICNYFSNIEKELKKEGKIQC